MINLGLAWGVAANISKDIQYKEKEVDLIPKMTGDLDSPVTTNDYLLRTHVIDNQTMLKGIINKQSLSILAIGSGFAFMSIGFALFLIGADGAFKFQGEHSGAKIVVSSTAPGIACFVLAALLVGIGITRTTQLNIKPTKYVNISEQRSSDIRIHDYPLLSDECPEGEPTCEE